MCLVTGGASGLGRATAEMLVKQGARVAVIADLPPPQSKGPQVAADITGGHKVDADRCLFLPTDVSPFSLFRTFHSPFSTAAYSDALQTVSPLKFRKPIFWRMGT